MGTDYNVFVGPYIRCINNVVEKDIDHFGCPRCRFPAFRGTFCSACGTMMRTFTVKGPANMVSADQVDVAMHENGMYRELWNVNDSPKDEDWYTGKIGKQIDPKYTFGLISGEPVDSQKEKQEMEKIYE